MRHFAIALLLLAAPLAARAADTPPPAIETRMDDATKQRTGIARLTPEELAALNAWLATEPAASPALAAAPAPAAAPAADRIGFNTPDPQAEEPRVASRIVGTFRGLTPRAQVTLENGQVWRSIDSTAVFRGITAESPAVEITKGTFGGWRLRLADYRGMAKVERVR